MRAALGEDAAAAAELLNLLERAAGSASCGESPETFAASLGLTAGVSGYCYHTVPVVVQAWLRRSEDFSALPEIIRCGGDTDTTAAILGGLIGARTGKEGIPREWTERTLDWPRSTQWIERVGLKLAEVCVSGVPQSAVPLAVWALPLRSLVFTIIVLAHGARRLLPQY